METVLYSGKCTFHHDSAYDSYQRCPGACAAQLTPYYLIPKVPEVRDICVPWKSKGRTHNFTLLSAIVHIEHSFPLKNSLFYIITF